MDKIYQKSSGGAKNAGFTLIELLVVVLIVGILAAVALPQYEYSVKKARFQQAVVLVDALTKAQTVYRMANGKYAADMEELDIAFPADFRVSGGNAVSRKMSCSIADSGRNYCMFRTGGLNNVAYIHFLSFNRKACVSFAQNDEDTHKFCKKFTGKDTYAPSGAWSIYYIDD